MLDRLKFWKKKEFSPPSYDGKLVCKQHFLEISELAQKSGSHVEIHAIGCEFCTEERRFTPCVGLISVGVRSAERVQKSSSNNNK